MSRYNLAFPLCLALAACGHPGSLPVDVKQCDTVLQGSTVSITALFENDADKPARDARLQIDFYNDFKFTRVNGIADFNPNLEPKTHRSVALILAGAQGVKGQAQRCAVIHIDYADGTTSDADGTTADAPGS